MYMKYRAHWRSKAQRRLSHDDGSEKRRIRLADALSTRTKVRGCQVVRYILDDVDADPTRRLVVWTRV
jgi:hypothetical protein